MSAVDFTIVDFLDEAERMRDGQDDAQGFVRLSIQGLRPLWGYIETANADVVQLQRVDKCDARGVPVRKPYLYHIATSRIIMARYADLAEIPQLGGFR